MGILEFTCTHEPRGPGGVRSTPGPGRDLKGGPDMQHDTQLRIDQLPGRATLTIEQTARLLGLGRTAAYDAARRGELPTRRLGRRLLVPVPALLEWLGAH
jgi:excisionase family DNA binding protein